MRASSAQGKGSIFAFTTLHNVPTKAELLAFLRNSDAQTEGSLVSDLTSFSMSNTPVVQAPRFGRLCVAEDNPCVPLSCPVASLADVRDRINLRHLAKNLDALGYSYTLCTNGQEALDVFREPRNGVDAVIIDMSMPVMGTFSELLVFSAPPDLLR